MVYYTKEARDLYCNAQQHWTHAGSISPDWDRVLDMS